MITFGGSFDYRTLFYGANAKIAAYTPFTRNRHCKNIILTPIESHYCTKSKTAFRVIARIVYTQQYAEKPERSHVLNLYRS